MAEAELLALGGPDALDPRRHGLKAHGLDQALRQGQRVPPAFALSIELARAVAQEETWALAQLEGALARLRAVPALPGEAGTLAVRASPTHSLPGALLTQLEVADDPASVGRAVRDVLASATTPALRERLVAEGLSENEAPWVGVLVQRQLRFGPGDFGAVLFTHDTHAGGPRLHGEFAPHGVADVVSGKLRPGSLPEGLAGERPDAWQALERCAEQAARGFDQPLDLELAYCAGEAWLLQARPLTFSARALVRLALAAIEEDSPRYAHWLRELSQRGLDSLVERHFAAEAAAQATALRGVAASPGAAQGVLVTDVQRAQALAREQPVILVRPDAVPEDLSAFRSAAAIVTSSGGLTCHAAVMARGLGVPAVVGVQGVRIDVAGGVLWGGRDGRQSLAREGDWLSVDARRGLVYAGRLALQPRVRDAELQRLFAEVRKLRPSPLWVAGPALEALHAKSELSLDGALCAWPEHGDLPSPLGRECWIEIAVEELELRLPTLPPGWGVVVRPGAATLSVASLRQRFPLRAWGVRFERPDAAALDAPLDLAVLALPADSTAHLRPVPAAVFQRQVRAARLLRCVNFSGDLPVPEETNVGWVCPVSTAALTALGYATQRAHHTRGVVG